MSVYSSDTFGGLDLLKPKSKQQSNVVLDESDLLAKRLGLTGMAIFK